jgi:hypothetical protein
MKKIVAAFMLICNCCFSQNAEDTLWSKNSMRFDVAGKALAGIGVVFERNLAKKHPEKHSRAFTSVEAGISYQFFLEDPRLFPGIGINRNWILGRNGKIILNAGVYGGPMISLDPTPKSVRQMYKDMNFYGGWVINPVEPWLIGDLGVKYMFERWFIKIGFTPLLVYNPFFRRFTAGPWAGISFGFRLKK